MKPRLPALLEEFGPLWDCLPPTEIQRMQDVLALLPELEYPIATEVIDIFRLALRSLPPVAESIHACPSVLQDHTLGGHGRNADSLIDALCKNGNLNMEFLMPTGAILGRAFVIAKLNFSKGLAYLLDSAGEPARDAAEQVKEMIGDTIFSKLAEELLTAAITNPNNDSHLKRAAAKRLILMWNDRLRLPVGEFPTALLSAWKARGKVRAIFGSLIGVTEVFSLIQAECESGFVNYFVREHVTVDESDAFREFLFGISYEELEQLKQYMEEQQLSVITPEQVGALLQNPVLPPHLGDPSAEQIYNSYRRRCIRADYRAIAGTPGPRKTAEGYIMEALLPKEV